MESIECQIIEGGCGDLLMVGGLGKPSLTCETRVGPDRQLYYRKGRQARHPRLAAGSTGGAATRPGRTSLGFRGRRDVEKPAGEWNRMEVVCDGDTITNIVNGFVVNVGTKSSLTHGKIQFQSEGAEILFRKIEVRPLREVKRERSVPFRRPAGIELTWWSPVRRVSSRTGVTVTSCRPSLGQVRPARAWRWPGSVVPAAATGARGERPGGRSRACSSSGARSAAPAGRARRR